MTQKTALDALYPRGSAWTRGWRSLASRLRGVIAEEFETVAAAAAAELAELFPETASRALSRWEMLTGVVAGVLPDGSLEGRRRAVVDGLAPPEDIGQAAVIQECTALGYAAVRFEQIAPFQASHSAAGDAVPSDAWAHVVDVVTPRGDHDDALRLLIRRRTQSHTLTRMRWQEPDDDA